MHKTCHEISTHGDIDPYSNIMQCHQIILEMVIDNPTNLINEALYLKKKTSKNYKKTCLRSRRITLDSRTTCDSLCYTALTVVALFKMTTGFNSRLSRMLVSGIPDLDCSLCWRGNLFTTVWTLLERGALRHCATLPSTGVDVEVWAAVRF